MTAIKLSIRLDLSESEPTLATTTWRRSHRKNLLQLLNTLVLRLAT
jgi:hypothetical protein